MASITTRFAKWRRGAQERISEDRERYYYGAAIAGSLIMGPGVLGAYKAVQESNELQRQREAYTAAGSEIAQQPYITGKNIGATGEIQISEGMKSALPLALLFIVVMYVMFKD